MHATLWQDLLRSLTVARPRRHLLARLLSGLVVVGGASGREKDAAAKHHHHKHRHRHKHHHHHHPPPVACPAVCPVCQTCDASTGQCEPCPANCKVCLTLADGGRVCTDNFIGFCGEPCTSSAGCTSGASCVTSSTDLATNTTMGLCGQPVGSGICTGGLAPCA